MRALRLEAKKLIRNYINGTKHLTYGDISDFSEHQSASPWEAALNRFRVLPAASPWGGNLQGEWLLAFGSMFELNSIQ